MKTLRRVIVLLMVSAVFTAEAQQTCPVAPVKGGECWTTEDVIDGHIDHHAQSAMLRMFAGGGAAAADASAMLCAVKTRQLEGIYLPDQGVPALRAQSVGSGWWLIIPQGQLSECYKQPPAEPPLIAFLKQIKDNKDYVAGALREAWKKCAIPSTAPRCYVATISKPKEFEAECKTDQDCYDKNSEGFWRCEQYKCVAFDMPPPPQPQTGCTRCDPLKERIYKNSGTAPPVCSADMRCSETTYCCEKIGGKEDQCVDRIVSRKFECRKLCDNEGERQFTKCFEGLKGGVVDAAKKTICAAKAAEYSKACKLKHSKKADSIIEECRKCAGQSCLSLTLDCTL